MRNRCTVFGCVRYVVTHGLCDAHRCRLKRHGQLESLRPDDWGKKTKHPMYVYWNDTRRREGLNLCEEWKTDFWKFVEALKERPSKNHFLRAADIAKTLGPDNWQWAEGLDKAQRLEIRSGKRRNNDRQRAQVSRNERAALFAQAGNKCEICGIEGASRDCSVTGSARIKTLCIDHDHRNGRLRGVLCFGCNSGIGHLKDDVALLESAIKYLTRTKVQT